MIDETFDDYLDEQGHIKLPEDKTLIDFVDKHSGENEDDLAYRYIDYSRERDGEYQELTWRQFGLRLRAVAARLQQVTKPFDRVACSARRAWTTSSRCSARSMRAISLSRCSTRRSPATPTGCTPCSVTASRRQS